MEWIRCPDPNGEIAHIDTFALSYDGYGRLGREPERVQQVVRPVLRHLEKHGEPPKWAGLDLLRGALFYLQRQCHHWGYIPPWEESQMRRLVLEIMWHVEATGVQLRNDYDSGFSLGPGYLNRDERRPGHQLETPAPTMLFDKPSS